MKSKVILIAVILTVAALDGYAFQYAKFITVSDIETVTGLKGVTPLPKSADADGDLNFGRKDGKLILSVTFLPVSAYAGYRSSKEGYKSAVSGVGEEAFIGPAGNAPPFLLVFRKAAYAVMLNTEPVDKSVRLSIEQLTALAKLIASRM
jgi:hypothetical protein